LPLLSIDGVADDVEARRARVVDARALMVAVSGIDASGKGTVAAQLVEKLHGRGRDAVLIGIDPWLAPLSVRFSNTNPALHFHEHGSARTSCSTGSSSPSGAIGRWPCAPS
jgi:uridine kinase